jgi:hypothetical protein
VSDILLFSPMQPHNILTIQAQDSHTNTLSLTEKSRFGGKRT